MSKGQQDEEQRLGRMGGKTLGPGGECVCPTCGYKSTHRTGEPCYAEICPHCGTRMTR